MPYLLPEVSADAVNGTTSYSLRSVDIGGFARVSIYEGQKTTGLHSRVLLLQDAPSP